MKVQSSLVKRQSKSELVKQVLLNTMLVFSLLAVVLAAGWAVFFKTDDAFLFGYKPYIVIGESMEPTIQKHAFVLIEQVDFDDVEVGEVIAFRSAQMSGAPVLHRVIDITSDGLITKGDAANIADEYLVTRYDFLGRELWYTNLTAKVYQMCQTPLGFFSLVIFPCLAAVSLRAVYRLYFMKPSRRPVYKS
jgi:signal peptidase